MDGRRKPDPKPENENEPIDEEIIDLTQVLEGGDDDDIIDLNEVLEQPGKAPDDTDEVVIPLVDAIPAEKATAPPEDTDEAIIDLGEAATTLDASISETEPEISPLPADETPPVAEADEDVIDLLDVTALDTPHEEVLAVPSTDDEKETAVYSEDMEEDIIDLEDVTTTLDADIAETEPERIMLPADEVSPAAKEDEAVIDLLDVTAPGTTGEDLVESPATEVEADIIDLMDVEKPEPEVSDDEELADLESRAEAMLITPAGLTGEFGEDSFDAEPPEEAAETAGPDADIMALDESEPLVENGQAAAETAGPPEADTPDEVEPVAPAAAAVAFSPVLPPEPPAAEPVPPTDQQVEAALERVIEKIYGEKIEQMMVQAIEKTVKGEIEKIKKTLLEEHSDGMAG